MESIVQSENLKYVSPASHKYRGFPNMPNSLVLELLESLRSQNSDDTFLVFCPGVSGHPVLCVGRAMSELD